jgi:serine/threonine protein kinase
MIMERCDQTLKSKFLDSDYDNPAKVGSIHSLQMKQMGELARYALQICSGLGYLHKKELVHRDIKLENILVNRKLVVLRTDCIGSFKSNYHMITTTTIPYLGIYNLLDKGKFS